MSSKWFIESQLGLNPPFLLRNIKKPVESFLPKNELFECSRFTLLDIDFNGMYTGPIEDVSLRGFIQSKNDRIPIFIDLKEKNTITTFSCLDEINLFVTTKNKMTRRMYFCKFFCCKNFHLKNIEAIEIGLKGEDVFIEQGTESIVLKCRIDNLIDLNNHIQILESPDNFKHILSSHRHYNYKTNAQEEFKFFKIFYLDSYYKIEEFKCPICLLKYNRLFDLISHINYGHLMYNCEFKNGVLKINSISSAYIQDSILREYSKGVISSNSINDTSKMFDKNFKGILFCKIKSKFPKNLKTTTINFDDKPIKILDYPLKIDKLQIEKEYESFNYCSILENHLNNRLLEENIDVNDLNLMKEWNSLKIQGKGIKTSIINCIFKFGLSKEIIKFMDILYTQGVLNSLDLMEILNNFTNKDFKIEIEN